MERVKTLLRKKKRSNFFVLKPILKFLQTKKKKNTKKLRFPTVSGLFFKKEKTPQEQEAEMRYHKWRKQLLQRKELEGKLIVDGHGNRSDLYLALRKKVLSDRQKKQAVSHRKRTSTDQTSVASTLPNTPLRKSDSEEIARPTHHRRGSSISQMVTSMFTSSMDRQPMPSRPNANSNNNSLTQIPLAKAATPHESYEFTGMHHIFDHHKEAVTNIQFAHEDRNLLAFASDDRTISIVNAMEKPSLIHRLEGHTDAITDFAWMATNDIIISASLDCSVCVWLVKTGQCLRTIKEHSPILSCAFHPINSNVFYFANQQGEVKAMNLSTGKEIKKLTLNQTVTYLRTDYERFLFAGDEQGMVHTLSITQTGEMLKIGSTRVASKPINFLQFKGYTGHDHIFYRSLLVNSPEGNVKLFIVNPHPTSQNQLTFDRQFSLQNSICNVKSRFCPVVGFSSTFCIVSGGEDMSVSIHDASREVSKSRINYLQGHSGVVHDVCWNYDESLLASCDETGIVIIWKRF